MRSRKDHTGRKYNHLTGISLVYVDKNTRVTHWAYLCDCGRERIAPSNQVTAGRIQSCGKCDIYRNTRSRSGSIRKATPSSLERVYRKELREAVRAGRKWDLPIGYYKELMLSNCAICGSPPDTHIHGLRGVYNKISLIHSTNGYTTENTLSCCKGCRTAASKIGISQLIELIYRAHKHLESLTTDTSLPHK